MSLNETQAEFANRQWGERAIECHELRTTARQDAEETARLRGVLEKIANSVDVVICDLDVSDIPGDVDASILIGVARAALACYPQPPRSRPLPEMRCDCCDNGLDDAWEFCPFCGTQHPDATGEPPDGR
jgi:hypothetical protein